MLLLWQRYKKRLNGVSIFRSWWSIASNKTFTFNPLIGTTSRKREIIVNNCSRMSQMWKVMWKRSEIVSSFLSFSPFSRLDLFVTNSFFLVYFPLNLFFQTIWLRLLCLQSLTPLFTLQLKMLKDTLVICPKLKTNL